ncbi:hypothetical protein KUCAC02_033001 [Chaenocephalus aceratus]|nr:hypothetical protein KUCAC02_033001 [Chaenocephalus aceratus]
MELTGTSSVREARHQPAKPKPAAKAEKPEDEEPQQPVEDVQGIDLDEEPPTTPTQKSRCLPVTSKRLWSVHELGFIDHKGSLRDAYTSFVKKCQAAGTPLLQGIDLDEEPPTTPTQKSRCLPVTSKRLWSVHELGFIDHKGSLRDAYTSFVKKCQAAGTPVRNMGAFKRRRNRTIAEQQHPSSMAGESNADL